MSVSIEKEGGIWTVIIDRPQKRNAVDRDTADSLVKAFNDFEQDSEARVAVLWGEGGEFCAGADLSEVARLSEDRGNRLDPDMSQPGPMGPTRMALSKPVIAAVAGHAVAGGLELACWCDIRVAEETAIFGVYCRRFGVPLIDGGTQRLPRIVGVGRALDMILTGRGVQAAEAREMGLVNYVVEEGAARREAERLAQQVAAFPQLCLQKDRESVYCGLDRSLADGMEQEFQLGLSVIESGETQEGAQQFVERDR